MLAQSLCLSRRWQHPTAAMPDNSIIPAARVVAGVCDVLCTNSTCCGGLAMAGGGDFRVNQAAD